MTMAGVCDSVPQNRDGPKPHLPFRAAPTAPFGGIVGTAAEAGTGLALPYSSVDIVKLDGPPSGRLLAADSVGGFAFDRLEPGTYRVRVRWFDHRFEMRDLLVKAATLDTFQGVLRYYRCTGY
jgi:hypothetical protein